MHLTVKQIAIMKVIVTGNPDGSLCDLDEIIDRLDYETTKASIQFSIRALIKHGLIEKKGTEKRRERKRVLIAPTESGKQIMGLRPKSSSVVVDEDTDELLRESEFLE